MSYLRETPTKPGRLGAFGTNSLVLRYRQDQVQSHVFPSPFDDLQYPAFSKSHSAGYYRQSAVKYKLTGRPTQPGNMTFPFQAVFSDVEARNTASAWQQRLTFGLLITCVHGTFPYKANSRKIS